VIRSKPLRLVKLQARAKVAVMVALSTKSREAIWGGQIKGAEITARSARQEAQKAGREAARAEAYAWSIRMEGLEVECNRCKTRASWAARCHSQAA
jgi:hypothetical protein